MKKFISYTCLLLGISQGALHGEYLGYLTNIINNSGKDVQIRTTDQAGTIILKNGQILSGKDQIQEKTFLLSQISSLNLTIPHEGWDGKARIYITALKGPWYGELMERNGSIILRTAQKNGTLTNWVIPNDLKNRDPYFLRVKAPAVEFNPFSPNPQAIQELQEIERESKNPTYQGNKNYTLLIDEAGEISIAYPDEHGEIITTTKNSSAQVTIEFTNKLGRDFSVGSPDCNVDNDPINYLKSFKDTDIKGHIKMVMKDSCTLIATAKGPANEDMQTAACLGFIPGKRKTPENFRDIPCTEANPNCLIDEDTGINSCGKNGMAWHMKKQGIAVGTQRYKSVYDLVYEQSAYDKAYWADAEWKNGKQCNKKGICRSGHDYTQDNIKFQDIYKPGVVYSGGKFSGLFMSGAVFNHALLEGALFDGAILWHAQLAFARLKNAIFTNANLEGANFQGSDLRNAQLNRTGNMPPNNLRWASFKNADMREANLRGSVLFETNFEGANLSGATWIDGRICAPGSIGMCR